jgi:hypothetical protein
MRLWISLGFLNLWCIFFFFFFFWGFASLWFTGAVQKVRLMVQFGEIIDVNWP